MFLMTMTRCLARLLMVMVSLEVTGKVFDDHDEMSGKIVDDHGELGGVWQGSQSTELAKIFCSSTRFPTRRKKK